MRGDLLKELANQSKLAIVDLTKKCSGEITRRARSKQNDNKQNGSVMKYNQFVDVLTSVATPGDALSD